jgi:hypothetical protein
MKSSLMRKLTGFMLAFMLMFGVLNVLAIQPALAQDAFQKGACQGANLDFSGNACDPKTDKNTQQAASKVDTIVHTALTILTFVVGVAAVFMIIFGGLRYITSGGDSAKISSAKDTILYAIVGLVVVAFAQIVVRFVLTKLS